MSESFAHDRCECPPRREARGSGTDGWRHDSGPTARYSESESCVSVRARKVKKKCSEIINHFTKIIRNLFDWKPTSCIRLFRPVHMKRSMVGFLASFLSLLLTLCCAKIHSVSPLGDFPTDPTTQTGVQSTDLASALSAASNNDVFYLCDGEEFEGPFTLTKNGCNLQSYPCTPSKAGIKPQLTVSKTFQGTPAVDPTSGQWTYDLSSYAQYFDAVPVIAALWINGTRYHPARYPNLVDPANPVGQAHPNLFMRRLLLQEPMFCK